MALNKVRVIAHLMKLSLHGITEAVARDQQDLKQPNVHRTLHRTSFCTVGIPSGKPFPTCSSGFTTKVLNKSSTLQ
jgi:hypothetical protein